MILSNIDSEYKRKFNEPSVNKTYSRNFKTKLPKF